MIKKIREYLKIILVPLALLVGAGIGGSVLVTTEVGIKAVDSVLEQLEPSPTPALEAK